MFEMRKVKREYLYTESGLDNVTLKNFPQYRCVCGETLLGIKNIESLHRTIASILTKKKSPLTGKEIRFIRKEMGLRAKDLAEILGVTPVTVSRWENDTEKPEIAKDKFIRLLYIQTIQEKCKEVIKGSIESLKSSMKNQYRPMEIKIPAEKYLNSLKVSACL
jgi:putative zinc finger/helix-turn-helix YgiT family protein